MIWKKLAITGTLAALILKQKLVPLLISGFASVVAEGIGGNFVFSRKQAAMAVSASAAAVFGVLLLVTFSLGFVRAAEEGLVLDLVSHTVSAGSDAPKLEVVLTSPDGSPVSSATVTLISAHSVATGSPVALSEDQKFSAHGDGKYELALQSSELSLGKYKVRIDASSSGVGKGYLTSVVAVTTPISVKNTKTTVVSSDGDVSESATGLDVGKSASLSASHTQKLTVSFELATLSGASFKAQQVILKLRHVASGAEEVYLVKPSAENLGYEHTVDFSKLGEKLKHQSGAYSVDLIVGDDVMENSFLWNVASLDLDLPEGPEETKPDAAVSKFARRAEIVHIFRQPEKRPPAYLSMTFLVLTLIPLVGFLVGLQQLGVNLKGLPSSGLPLAAAAGLHGGIAMILGLYLMFWLQLNLFTTLKWLCFLGLLTLVPGFQILSYLADQSVKVKTS